MTTGLRIRIKDGVPEQPIHLLDEITWSTYPGDQSLYEQCIASQPEQRKFERVNSGNATKNSDGIWVVEWNYTPLSQDEIDRFINDVQMRIRGMRRTQLFDSDWTQLPDSQLTEEKKEEWKLYRQSLRDITKNQNWSTDPEQIVMPLPPGYPAHNE